MNPHTHDHARSLGPCEDFEFDLVERSFGWVNRFRRLARDYERLPETLAGLHYVVFSILMLGNAAALLQGS